MKKSCMFFNQIVRAKQETTLMVDSLDDTTLCPTMLSFPSSLAGHMTVTSFKIGDEEFLTGQLEATPGTRHHIPNAPPSAVATTSRTPFARRFCVTVKNDAEEDQRFRMLIIGVRNIDANKPSVDIDLATQRLRDNYLKSGLSKDEAELIHAFLTNKHGNYSLKSLATLIERFERILGDMK